MIVYDIFAFYGPLGKRWFYDYKLKDTILTPTLPSDDFELEIDFDIPKPIFNTITKAISNSGTELTQNNLKFIWHLYKNKLLNNAM